MIPLHPVPKGINVPAGYQTFMKDHNCPNAFITNTLSCYKNLIFFFLKIFLTTFLCCFTSTLNLRSCLILQWENKNSIWESQSLLCSILISLHLIHTSMLSPVVNWAKKANPSRGSLSHFFYTQVLCSHGFSLSPPSSTSSLYVHYH